MKIDSIIFDLDGTLWDSTEVVVIAWNDVISKYPQVKDKITIEKLKSIMGLQAKEIGRRLLPELNEEDQWEAINRCCRVECDYLEKQGGKLYDNLEKTLEQLAKKYKMFIVSNCQCGYIETFLKAHKLERFFSDFENPGRTGLSKGENIRLIIERNNLTSSIYVGDTEGDFKAARAANVPFIYARYGFGKVSGYDYVIDNFSELLNITQ